MAAIGYGWARVGVARRYTLGAKWYGAVQGWRSGSGRSSAAQEPGVMTEGSHEIKCANGLAQVEILPTGGI